MTTTIRQSTSPLEPSRRFEFWKDTILVHVDLALRTERDAFSCERLMTAHPRGTTVDTRSTPFALSRSRRRIARDDVDTVALCTLMKGRGSHSQGGRDVAFAPGDLVISDLGQPYDIATSETYREARIYVDRALFEDRLGAASVLGGLRLAADAPLVGPFTAYLAAYVAAVPTMKPADVEAGLDGVLHLLAGLIGRKPAERLEEAEALTSAGIDDLATAYIARRLTHPGLGVASMVRDLGVSRTRLYATFAERGGVEAAIRDARLDRVRSRLRGDTGTIEEIALATGWRNYVSFFRAFQRRFGVTPSQYRAGRLWTVEQPDGRTSGLDSPP